MARKRNTKRNQAARTQFTPTNPGKYRGTYPIWMRSRWEIMYAQNLDRSPHVASWASEPVQIPYRDPLTGKQKVYVPDFLVHLVYKRLGLTGVIQVNEVVLVEIKPSHEAYIKAARNKTDAAQVVRNTAKWAAAKAWCNRRNAKLKILTEKDLFIQKMKKKKPV